MKVPITFTAKPELREALSRAAAEEELSISAIIRNALRKCYLPSHRLDDCPTVDRAVRPADAR